MWKLFFQVCNPKDVFMKSMNLPGLDCRPSKKLNSGTLLHHSFETANAKRKGLFDYSVIALRDLNFSRCPASGVCGKKKDSDEYMLCIQHDDMDQLLAAMKEVDGILVATPVCLSLSSDLFSSSSCLDVCCVTRISSLLTNSWQSQQRKRWGDLPFGTMGWSLRTYPF